MFRSTATALSGIILGHSSSDKEVSTVALSSSLAVLDRLIDINQSAQVIKGFTAIVETISACIPENFIGPNAQQSLTRIRRRLNIGSSLPLAPTQTTPQNLLSAAFELAYKLNIFRPLLCHAKIYKIRYPNCYERLKRPWGSFRLKGYPSIMLPPVDRQPGF